MLAPKTTGVGKEIYTLQGSDNKTLKISLGSLSTGATTPGSPTSDQPGMQGDGHLIAGSGCSFHNIKGSYEALKFQLILQLLIINFVYCLRRYRTK